MIVSVATITLLTGCSLLPDSDAQARPVPTPLSLDELPTDAMDFDVTTPMSPPYDEWVNWTSGRDPQYAAKDRPYLKELSMLTGIDGLESPSEQYLSEGYAGVARFQRYCVITVAPSPVDEDKAALTIVPRINFAAQVIMPEVNHHESYEQFTEFYRNWCDGGEWPGIFPGETIVVIGTVQTTNEA